MAKTPLPPFAMRLAFTLRAFMDGQRDKVHNYYIFLFPQLSQETSITKEGPRDEWEFPRHRLRIFNIVGEGAFGQVWRAQAIDIDGKQEEL